MMFFKNVKLMFWGDAVVCATYLRNRNPSDLMLLKTRLHMNCGLAMFLRLGISDFLVPLVMPSYQRRKETNLVLEFEDAFSWGIQILPRHVVFMMR